MKNLPGTVCELYISWKHRNYIDRSHVEREDR